MHQLHLAQDLGSGWLEVSGTVLENEEGGGVPVVC
ncbi:MAG: hypothetical protein JWQ87_3734 [Candidatus Sulfotelmatobacter sp.]|nr:hypothetical protein [Candidatus Sulfotelmatobacter sp.]